MEKRFLKFKMGSAGYIFVSKKTRKVHAISLSGNENNIRIIGKQDSEAKLIVLGMLVTAAAEDKQSFIEMMNNTSWENDYVLYECLWNLQKTIWDKDIKKTIDFHFID